MGRERFMDKNEECTDTRVGSSAKKAALRAFSACVSGSVSSDEDAASDSSS